MPSRSVERRIVAADRTREDIAALERARAQIEAVLGSNPDWLALRRIAAGPRRLAHEPAFAADPLYRSWKLLNEAIEELQAKAAQRHVGDPGAVPDDLGRMRGAAADPALLRRQEPPRPVGRPEARSIELHHVLRHIRDSAVQAGDAPSAASPARAAATTDDAGGRGAAGVAQPEPEQGHIDAAGGVPGWEAADRLVPEPHEASVTFVIREEAPVASAGGDAVPGAGQDGRLSDQWAAVGTEDSLYASTDGEVEEAEVVIVSRAPDRRSRGT
jgi:hypothetical protein